MPEENNEALVEDTEKKYEIHCERCGLLGSFFMRRDAFSYALEVNFKHRDCDPYGGVIIVDKCTHLYELNRWRIINDVIRPIGFNEEKPNAQSEVLLEGDYVVANAYREPISDDLKLAHIETGVMNDALPGPHISNVNIETTRASVFEKIRKIYNMKHAESLNQRGFRFRPCKLRIRIDLINETE